MDGDWLARQFEEHRPRLRAVAYRMLGSLSEAEDAVQDSWLRVSRADTGGIENMGGWLTTVVSRVCLNLLRGRAERREQSLETHLPDPIVTSEGQRNPEQELLLADSVGLALLVKLETFPAATVPGTQHDVDFMVKDSKRFADTGGWGWAVFKYEAASGKFTPGTSADAPPQGNDAKCGFACHTIVKTRDYVFTDYGRR
jgi:hypothetical protein